ncbi:hypothetical protein B0H16DRAFT_1521517, partial [Mycena metata]
MILQYLAFDLTSIYNVLQVGYLSPFLQIMDIKPPRRTTRKAAENAAERNAIPFQPGGAFDSQVDSQQYVEELYKDAGQSMHVHERPERPPKPRTAEAEAEEEYNNHLRAELETTKAELKETKRALRRAKRAAQQWRATAITYSTAFEKAAKEISVATRALDVVQILSDS